MTKDMVEGLKEIGKLAASKSVSFSLIYNEASDTWGFTIDSAAHSENSSGEYHLLVCTLTKLVENLTCL